ncbi:hypothetical protein EST38_g9289, partial [Candolleomyces aberdarensis]
MHSSPFPSTGHRASAPLDLIHSDLCGPLSVSTPEGYRYWCVFIDDHTRYRVVVLLFEAWFGRKPDLSRFRVFGCTAYVFVQKDKRKKLESHMQKCIFVGYPPDYSAWTFYNPVTKQFIISECAEFDERVFPGLSTTETTPNAQLRLLETPASQSAPLNSISLPIAPEDSDASQTLLSRPNTLPTPPVANSNPPSPAASPAPAPFLDLPPPPPAVPPPAPQPPAPLVPPAPPAILRQSQREVKKPGEWWKVPRPAPRPYERPQRAPSLTPDPIPASPPPAAPVVLPEPAPAPAPQLVPAPVDNWEPRHPSPAIADSDDSDNDLGGYAEVHAAQVGGDPRTFKQAMASPQAQHWEAAAADEILTLIANGTWELVELPPGAKAIPSGWVFKTKRTSTGDVERYK